MRFFGMNFHRLMEQAGTEDQGGNGGTTQESGQAPQGQEQSTTQGQEGGQAPQKTDFSTLPQDVQEYISRLRGENAERRTENNNLKTQSENIKSGLAQIFGEEEGGKVDPVEAFQAVSHDLEMATVEASANSLR